MTVSVPSPAAVIAGAPAGRSGVNVAPGESVPNVAVSAASLLLTATTYSTPSTSMRLKA